MATSQIQNAIENLNQIERDLNDRKANLDLQAEEIIEAENRLTAREKEVDKRIQSLNRRIREAGGLDGIAQAEHDINQRTTDLNMRERELADKELKISQQITQLGAIEKRLNSREQELAEKATLLAEEKKNMRAELIEELTSKLGSGL